MDSTELCFLKRPKPKSGDCWKSFLVLQGYGILGGSPDYAPSSFLIFILGFSLIYGVKRVDSADI